MYIQNQIVFVDAFINSEGIRLPYGKNGKFLRAHLNGITCAVELRKGNGIPANGVVCCRVEDIYAESNQDSKALYLGTGDGKQFVELLREHEHTLYAKVRYPEAFFKRYLKATGTSLYEGFPGILLSKQASKYGDEMSIRFSLINFEPVFPANVRPRLDASRGILNDNQYIWALIEDHGFRFGKVKSE
jgi:hypothetical protein